MVVSVASEQLVLFDSEPEFTPEMLAVLAALVPTGEELLKSPAPRDWLLQPGCECLFCRPLL